MISTPDEVSALIKKLRRKHDEGCALMEGEHYEDCDCSAPDRYMAADALEQLQFLFPSAGMVMMPRPRTDHVDASPRKTMKGCYEYMMAHARPLERENAELLRHIAAVK